MQNLKEIAEDAKLLDRCEAKKKNGQERHRQCGEDVQNIGRQALEKGGVEKVGGSIANAGRVRVGRSVEIVQGKDRSWMQWLPPQSPPEFDNTNDGKIVEFLEKVELSGRLPQQACTTMFFLMPKNVTSERPIALMPTLIRWWEALRATEVAKWQQR